MQCKTFYWLIAIMAYEPIYHKIIYKYGKRKCQLKFQRELKSFPSRNNGGQKKMLRTGVE